MLSTVSALYFVYLVTASIVMVRPPLPPLAIVAVYVGPLLAYHCGRFLVNIVNRRLKRSHAMSGRDIFKVKPKWRKWVRRIIRVMLIGTWVFNALDVTYSLNAMASGMLVELNPLVSWWIDKYWYLVPAYKYVALAFATGIIIRASKRWSALVGAICVLLMSLALSYHWYQFFMEFEVGVAHWIR